MKSNVFDRNDDKLYIITPITRHKTNEVKVGNKTIGGNNPVVVQSMARGPFKQPDNLEGMEFQKYVQEAVEEVIKLASAGSELISIALNSDASVKSVPYIKEALVKEGFDDNLIVGYGKYLYRFFDEGSDEGSKVLSKIYVDSDDERFESIIKGAVRCGIPVRIGVNWDKALDLNSVKRAEEFGLSKDKIVISCKVSEVQDLIFVYTELARLCDYALHLCLTEADGDSKTIINTVAGLSYLLQNGIGDTICVSLTQRAGEPSTNEVKLCQEILQAIGLRHFEPQLTSCPGCGRTNGHDFRKLAEQVDNYMKDHIPIWKNKNPGVEYMNVAVMGCVVNGPGESRHANLGISLPGYGEKPVAAVYADGKYFRSLKGDNIFEEFTGIIEEYVSKHYCKVFN